MDDRAGEVPARTRTRAAHAGPPSGRTGTRRRPRSAPGRHGRARRDASGLLPPPGPQRTLIGSVLAVTVGGGLLLGNSTLYLTRVVGMSASEVGLGLTVGAAVGLVAGPLVGHLADRRGPREVHIATMLFGAAATAGFVIVRTFWALVAVSLLTTLVGVAGQASRAPLIRALASGRSTWFLSYQRAVTNVGVMAGMLIGTIGIVTGSAPVYIAMILASAATFLVACAVLAFLPHIRPLEPASAGRRWVALTDRPYLTITAINGVISTYLAVPTFALPLWIVTDTSAPRATVTGFVLVNGLLVALLQVRVSKGVVDPIAAGRRMQWAGGALLVSLALIGMTARLPEWTAMAVLLAAAIVYTFGELWQSAASFELAFGLALPHAQGQYAGAFSLGQGAATTAAPALLAALCLEHGLVGWVALGVLLMGFGLVTPGAVRWALRSRLDASHSPAQS